MRTTGILPDHEIAALFDAGALRSVRPLDADQIQPASLDLRLGQKAWRVRASFLPGPDKLVADKLDRLKLHEIDLSDGAVLETGCVYIVPLLETLALPAEISASANPKSSTGRLDIFTRVMTDRGHEFDKIPAGYTGPLYLEVSPRTFPIVARTGSRLSQIRFRKGNALLSESELQDLHRAEMLVATEPPNISGGGIALSIDLGGEKRQPDRLSRQAPHRSCRCRQARRPRRARFLGTALQPRRRRVGAGPRRILHPRVARGRPCAPAATRRR